jgi:hypothetical protein
MTIATIIKLIDTNRTLRPPKLRFATNLKVTWMAIGPAKSSRSRSEAAADEALRIAREAPGGPINKYNCWGAVLFVLFEKKIISKSTFDDLRLGTTQDNFSRFLPPECPGIPHLSELRIVPRGSILGFIKERDGRPFLAHAMLYVGDGQAVGLNNGAIGQSPAWSVVDLASPNVANWGDLPSFSYQEVASSNRARVRVIYRDIDDMTNPSCTIM